MPDQMPEDLPWSQPLRVADLPGRKPTRFDISPDAATSAAIAAWAGIDALDGLRLKGEIRPLGKRDFRLEAAFSARVTQPCAITLAPVVSDLRETVARSYVAGLEMPSAEETEMPEDDSLEPLPEVIDLAAVALEALELALPMFPRAKGAELGEIQAGAPGAEPLTEESIRPFAGLKDLLAGREKDKGNKG
jgi:uncharacterized metal-binding protein YceD (DUF177 family)